MQLAKHSGNKIILAFVFLTFIATSLFAQTEDPLSKPKVWAALKKNPNSDQMWMRYFEKDLFDLNKEEYEKYKNWKNELLVEYKKIQEEKEITAQKRRDAYFAQRYGKATGELDYEELVQNVYKNFPMIEQYFTEQFKRYGEKYEPYAEKHPDGKFNKTKWVEEQEIRLEDLEINN